MDKMQLKSSLDKRLGTSKMGKMPGKLKPGSSLIERFSKGSTSKPTLMPKWRKK